MQKRYLFIFITFFLISPSILSAQSSLSAYEILKRSEEIYSTSKSYSDKGHVQTIFYTKKGKAKFATKLVFKTSFIRPQKFRFEYAEDQAGILLNSYIIWQNGVTVKSYWEVTGEENPKSLSYAIAAATGVSGGSALNISSLLISNICREPLLTRIKKPVLLKDENDENGVPSYRIKGGRNEIIFIQKDSFLISKIIEYNEFDDFDTISTTVYRPEINQSIPETDLQFRNSI